MCKSASDVNDWIANEDRNQSAEQNKKETVILTEVRLPEKPTCVGLYPTVAAEHCSEI